MFNFVAPIIGEPIPFLNCHANAICVIVVWYLSTKINTRFVICSSISLVESYFLTATLSILVCLVFASQSFLDNLPAASVIYLIIIFLFKLKKTFFFHKIL